MLPYVRDLPAGPIEDVRVSVSYDDGATWRRVPLVPRRGDHYTAILVHPPAARTSGWVSLRAEVTDADGATLKQTTIRAYALEGHGPAEIAERDRTRASTVSARNRMSGIVTRVKRDHVMAQVEMICGPYRVVSLMSSDAADELGLEPGVRAIASVKSTNVVVEVPK